MAAALALARDSELQCDYVGIVPSAKGYGNLRMYVLKERPVRGAGNPEMEK